MKCSTATELGCFGDKEDNHKQRNWLVVLNHCVKKIFPVSPPGLLQLVVHIS